MLNKMAADTNALNWFDIPVDNLERARKFYEEVFDIKMETTERGDEAMAFFPRKENVIMGTSGILSGSLLKSDRFHPGADGPVIYLNASPRLSDILGRVETAGGKVIMPETEIPAGHIALCLDTEGNRIGCMRHIEEEDGCEACGVCEYSVWNV